MAKKNNAAKKVKTFKAKIDKLTRQKAKKITLPSPQAWR